VFLTDPSEIINIVSNYEDKMSLGVDEISIWILKCSIHSIAEPLSVISNSSMQNGVFPDLLKIAKICPIFKSRDKQTIENYKPISMLSSFSKKFENVIFNRLLKYIDSKNILCNNQYGFRKKHSTYMSLIDMYKKISLGVEKNEFSIGFLWIYRRRSILWITEVYCQS